MNAHDHPHESPVALLGYPSGVARALRELGLVALPVPDAPPADLLGALRVLRFAGLLAAPTHEDVLTPHGHLDPAARRAGRVDAVSLAGAAPDATHTLEEAILRGIQNSGYAVRGARVMVIGTGATLRGALGLARLGLAGLTVAASTRPEAEAALAALPAGVRGYGLTIGDEALVSLAERADLVVLAGVAAPSGVLQPFHTVLDLTGDAAGAARAGAAVLPLAALPALRLALQLEHATGQRFHPEALAGAVTLVGGH